MSKRQSILFCLRLGTDIFAISIAWIAAYYIRFFTFIDAPRGIPHFYLYLKLLPFIWAIWLLVFFMTGFYRRSLRVRSAVLEAIDIVQSCFIAMLAFIAFTYFYSEYKYSRLVLIVFGFLHPMMIIAGRSIFRKALRYYRRHQPERRILFIGGGDLLELAIQMSRYSDFHKIQPYLAIIVANEHAREPSMAICQKYNIAHEPLPDDWADFLHQHNIHTVYIAISNDCYQEIDRILPAISEQITDVRIVPDLLRYTKFSAGMEIQAGLPVITLHESPLEGPGSLVKRAIDFVGSLVLLILLSPLMLMIALLVKLSSPGPVFYRQERMGLDGKTFDCLKFRSMPVDAEAATGPVWARPGESRATPVGRFLRRYSLDELPQLINVLRGEMSLVGPRPERPVFVGEFRKKVPGYMLRHKVKAGITGWAQVNGWRGDTSLEKRIEYDLFYIQNWSVWLDIKIMFMTISEIFFSKSAY